MSSSIVFANKNLCEIFETFDQPVLINLQQCGLDLTVYQIETLFEKLPVVMQPQLFSAVVKEVLKLGVTTVTTCLVAIEMECRIRSQQFQEGTSTARL